jgi:CRP/FNR family transcriptional regulator
MWKMDAGILAAGAAPVCDLGSIRLHSAAMADDLRAKLLERFPFFASLPARQLDALLAQAQTVRAPRGSVIFDARQPCRGFPLVLEGSVRVTQTAPNGREIVLYRVDPGDGCVLSGGCLLGRSDYSASGVADGDVTLLSIPPALFQQLLLEFEPFRRFVFGMYGARLAEVMQLVEEVAFRRLDARLAQLLVHRGPVIGATHQKLAEELGSVREIVSRLLRQFEDRGWVELGRERVTIRDPRALAELAKTAH